MKGRLLKKSLSVFLALVMVLGIVLPYLPARVAKAIESDSERKVQFTYVREDQKFGDWNIWVWNTGAKNDEILFDTYNGKEAVANIAVGADATSVGFVLRSTHDWNTAEKEFSDRFIPLSKNDKVTKVYVTSGVEKIRVVADGSAPVIEEGNATFYYREPALFADNTMNTIEKVELKFNNEVVPMTYDAANERFVASYKNIPNGKTPYSFLVTVGGQTKEVTDPYNKESVIDFEKYDVSVSGSVAPVAIDYNQNAVLKVDVQSKGNVNIKKITADLSELGGPKAFAVNPTLKETTLSVDQKVTTGTKTIPITVVDNYGNAYNGSTTLEVKTRQMVGKNDFDWDESVIYFMLTDRFFDGNKSNDNPYGLTVNKEDRGTYQGGDFAGITKKLDYLKDLGVNTIWISPIVENIKYNVRNGQQGDYYAYHGYWASNFQKLNPYFGSMEEFQTLIDEAHDRGMKLMVDVVLNHTGYGLKEIDGKLANPPAGYPTDEDRARFANIVRQGDKVGDDQVVGELAGLPDVMTENPTARQQIIDWQTDWIQKSKTAKGNTIDYFRVDTVKHVENTTWMAFKNAITKEVPNFKMIGEVWGASGANNQGYLQSGMMDSVLDFNFKDVARSFVSGSLQSANDALINRNGALSNTATAGQFLSSHDEDGFLYSLGNDKGKFKVAASLQLTAKGQPVIYYGEEIGLSGANNYPQYDNRYDFAWDKVDGNDMLAHYKKVLAFRNANTEIFAKGDRKTVAGSDGDKYLLVSRTYNNQTAYVGLNVADKEKEVTFTVDMPGAKVTNHYDGKEYVADGNGQVTIVLPANGDGGTILLTTDKGNITGAVDEGVIPANTLRIHYQRTAGDHDKFGVWAWDDVNAFFANWPTDALKFSKSDDFGGYVDVPLKENAAKIGFLVVNRTTGDKDGGDRSVEMKKDLKEVWLVQGSDKVYTEEPVSSVPDGNIRIHYKRSAGDYNNLGLWLWNDVKNPSANWPSGGTPFHKFDSYGAYVDVPLRDGAKNVGFLVLNTTTGDKDGGDKGISITPGLKEVWVEQGSDKVYTYEPVALPKNTVRVHYVRKDNTFDHLGLWTWGDVESPTSNWPTGGKKFDGVDKYGAYVDLKLKEDAKKMSFLVLNTITGDKDGSDKSFNLLDRYNQLWIKEGDDTVYVSPQWEVATGLTSAEITSGKDILLHFTMTDGLTEDTLKDQVKITDTKGNTVAIKAAKVTGKQTAEITVDFNADNAPLKVTFMGKTVTAQFGWRYVDKTFGYNGNDLGATYNKGNATLKLWAPKASKVVANFYDKTDATKKIGSMDLKLGDKGVWTVDVKASDLKVKDLNGYYYQYEVTNDGVTRTVLDPYAKSLAAFTVDTKGNPGPDGDTVGKAAIVDLSNTSPKGYGFANIPGYKKREDAIVYETHVRDFTSDPSIEGDLHARWGSYKAFIDKLDYIKSLGVTHIQLLPVMAWYFGDETKMGQREMNYSASGNEYNWGYDPQSYFAPDGAYSENPKDAALRVKELKELINAIHNAGMGVVLDVVYTHMAKTSLLNDIVPNYYEFQDAQGNFLGGFGNNLATNRMMAEKLMVDSVKYWFNEYKIDGMRFDMMGDASYPAIQAAYDAAAKINPKALFIGEGWRTFAGQLDSPELAGMGADQDWMNKTNDVGVFSDEIRNELKSGFGSEGEPRFLTGGARDLNTIFNNIKAQPSNTPADDPGDMVQYIEAHDNLPLYDVIAQSIKKDPAIPANDLEIHKRIRLGNTMILTSQGTAFLQAGQEYGRTKQWLGEGIPEQKYSTLTDENGKPFKNPYFIHDSYDSSDAINKFDWNKAVNGKGYDVNHTTQAFTKGLIALRRSTDAFRLGEKSLVDKNVTMLTFPETKTADLAIAYKSVSTDNTGTYYVFVNADNTKRTFTLGDNKVVEDGQVLVDSDEAGITAVKEKSGFIFKNDVLTMDPLTTVVVKVGGKDNNGGDNNGNGNGNGGGDNNGNGNGNGGGDNNGNGNGNGGGDNNGNGNGNNNGGGNSNGTNSKNPNTGDPFNDTILMVILLAGAAGIVVVRRKLR